MRLVARCCAAGVARGCLCVAWLLLEKRACVTHSPACGWSLACCLAALAAQHLAHHHVRGVLCFRPDDYSSSFRGAASLARRHGVLLLAPFDGGGARVSPVCVWTTRVPRAFCAPPPRPCTWLRAPLQDRTLSRGVLRLIMAAVDCAVVEQCAPCRRTTCATGPPRCAFMHLHVRW